MTNLKLGVEVASARNLMPKDGQGAASAFVELHFDHQIAQTTTKEKEVNPVWDESFYFNISDPDHLSNLTLEAYVYHRNSKPNSKSFLGKVCLPATLFVPYSDAVVMQSYPLQKRGILNSAVKGELGLKVFATDHYLPASKPILVQQQDIPSAATQPSANKEQEMNSGPQGTKSHHKSGYQKVEHSLLQTIPRLRGGEIVGGRFVRGDRLINTSYDLVETMHYLFVRVVKALDLPLEDVTGNLDLSVYIKVGKYEAYTKQNSEKKQNPEWNEVFTFARDNLQYSSVLDVMIKGKDLPADDFVGSVKFNLHEVPTRVPPDTPLSPKWYQLSPKDGEQKGRGQLILAVWYGTQADEAFPDAWHSDAVLPADASPAADADIRSKVYQSPRLWCVRVNVIEAQDLVVSSHSRIPVAYAKVQISNQCLKTRKFESGTLNPIWNEELMFVAAEPFDDDLIVSVEDHVSPDKDEQLGKIAIALNSVERRVDDRTICSKWFDLKMSIPDAIKEEQLNVQKDKFASRIHLCVVLDGGYHVPDESTDYTHYSIHLLPAAKELWKPPIGVLELGILDVVKLIPTKTRKGKGTSDPYCVAKYGHKWIRTRTIIDSLNPKYNEHHSWEVHDLSTFLTVGVFDNSQISNSNGNKDVEVGKIRIRLSTLEVGRVYTHCYPLLSLGHSGIKKTGELHLAIRVSCTSLVNMMFKCSQPLLPKMHFIRPLTVVEQDILLEKAVSMVADRLGQAVPPLRMEVVHYMSDNANIQFWSMRRSKANFFRLMNVIGRLIAVGKWFGEICMWKNPITTTLVHVLFLMLVCTPELILPTIFLYMFVEGVWYFQYRPRHPPHIDTRLSHADSTHPDELDEEFDVFPTSRPSDITRMRYDRLRCIAGRIQTVLGDVVTQGERIQELLSWRDPCATGLFTTFCLVAAIVLCVIPFKALVILTGMYLMRHPRLRRGKMPSVPFCFLTRLPTNADCIILSMVHPDDVD